MTYYVLCTPCLGDPAKALWYPGSVNWAFVEGRRPPLFAVYQSRSLRQISRVIREAYTGFGAGCVPKSPISGCQYTPERGDVILSVVAPLSTTSSERKEASETYNPLVALTLFPDQRSVHEMPRITVPGAGGGLRRLELNIRLVVSSFLI